MREAVSAFGLVATLVASPLPSLAQGPDPDLEKGIRLVKQGEYGQAILVLDSVAKRLAQKPAAKKLTAQAYLHLGIAHVGEGQETLAKAAFRNAVARDETLEMGAFEVSPKVRELFQKAKDELAQQKAAVAPPKKGGSKAPLILVGVLGAVGGGAALALGGGGEEHDGDGGAVEISITMGARTTGMLGIVGVEITFNATFGGAGPSSITWDFGDGNTGTGQTVRHTYTRDGTFNVVVRTTDPSATASLSLTVRSLAGTWDTVDERGRAVVVQIAQSGRNVTGDASGQPFSGTVGTTGPEGRAVALNLFNCSQGVFNGTINDSVTTITSTGPASLPCGTFFSQTLTRRP
jgi:hypothetical protein